MLATTKLHPASLLLSMLALLLMVPLLAFSVIYLEGPRLRQEALTDLNAIGQLKASQIESWLAERRGDADMLKGNPGFLADVELWFSRADAQAKSRLDRQLANLRQHHGYQVALLDVRGDLIQLDPGRRALLADAMASGQTRLSELYRDSAGRIWLDWLVPLGKTSSDGVRWLGVAVLHTSPDAFLFPLIQSWPTASPSAETLLLRRDGNEVLFLNELRHSKGSALTLRRALNTPDLRAVVAARTAAPKVIETSDYRGIPVLAAVRPIAGTTWFLAAKVDRAEVMQPLHTLARWIGGVALFAALAIALALLLLWRQQQRGHRFELLARTGERDRLLSLFYQLPFMGMAITDPADDRWLHANDRLCEILGYSHEELMVGTNWRQLMHADDRGLGEVECRRLLAGEIDGYQVERRFLRKDGSYVDLGIAVKSVRGADGGLEYLVLTVGDVTVRKRYEQALLAQQRATGLLNAIADASTDVIFAKDVHGDYLFYNLHGAHALNLQPRDVLGKNDADLFTPEVAARIMAQDREILETGATLTFEEVFPAADGSELTFLTTKGPLYDSEGGSLGLYGIARDISQRKQSEIALRESEQRFRNLFEQIPTLAVQGYDRQRRVIYWNDASETLYGYSQAEALGQPLEELIIPPPMRAGVVAAIADWIERGNAIPAGRLELLRRDGSLVPVYSSHVMQWNGRGEPEMYCVDIDLRDFEALQAELRASELRFRKMADSAPVLIWVAGTDQGCSWFNQQWLDFTGRTLAQEMGNGWSEGVHPDDLANCLAVYREHFERREPFEMEYRLRRADGQYRWLLDRGVPHFSPADEFIGYIGSCVDVTARKLAEEARHANEERLGLALRAANAGIWDWDIRTGAMLWSPENYALYGLDPSAGMPTEADWERCIHPDDLASIKQAIARVREGIATEYQAEFRVRSPVFGERWLSGMGRVERAADGAPVRMTGINLNISRRKWIEQALDDARKAAVEEKNLLETVMQVLPVGVAIVDSHGFGIRHNRDYDRIWRGPRPPLLTVADNAAFQAWWVDSGKPLQPHEWASAQAIEQGELVANQMLRIQRFDGSQAYVMNSAAPIRDGLNNIIGSAVVIQDITELKQVEHALRDSQERFELSAEIGRSATWDWNVLTNEVIWSRSHFEILGYQPDEVEPSYEAWISRVHPEERALVDAEISRCMREKSEYLVVYRVVWPDTSVRWLSARGRYEYDDDGLCVRMVGAMADITSLKQAELALREADRRKDEFLAMLSHELRNPLTPIRNAAHVLGQLDVNEPRVRWAQAIIERQVTHLTHLVDELLDVSRIARDKVTLKLARIELADLVRQACESVQPLMAAKKHHFQVKMPPASVVLNGDLVRLIQVFQNLLDNAAKYTPDGGHIEFTGRLLAGEVELRVRDNGVGMPADLLPGVFELFLQGERSLDRSQGGLGIGLTVVRRMLELHGGRVMAESPGIGQGATFTVHLPLAEGVAESAALTDSGPAAAPTGLKVLVVDDDPVVAESMVVFLEMDGHQVRSANGGEAAMRVLREFWPHVVLLDIGLPGQDGYQVAQRIRQLPGADALKLVAVSGYGQDNAKARSLQAGFDRHLVKPVDPDKLCTLLAELCPVDAWVDPR